MVVLEADVRPGETCPHGHSLTRTANLCAKLRGLVLVSKTKGFAIPAHLLYIAELMLYSKVSQSPLLLYWRVRSGAAMLCMKACSWVFTEAINCEHASDAFMIGEIRTRRCHMKSAVAHVALAWLEGIPTATGRAS